MPESTAPTIERLEELSPDGRSAPVSAPWQDLVRFETDDPILSWLKPLFILWMIFSSLHVAQLSHLSLSVDNEFAAAIPKNYLFLIEQGRWGAFLIDGLALPIPIAAVPFFPIAVYGLFGAAAYLVAVFALTGRKPSALAYLLFPLFIAHPVLQFQQFFSVNVTPQGMALLLAWTGALLSSKVGRFGVESCLLTLGAILCGCLSISSYQSNATLVLDCLLIVACAKCVGLDRSQIEAPPSSNPFKLFGIIALIMAGSVGLYKLIAELMLSAWQINKTNYLDQFFHPELLLRMPGTVLRNTLLELGAVYGIEPTRYGIPGVAIAFLMGASVCLLALWVVKSRQRSKLLLVSLLVSILFVPFALSVLNCGALPLRTYAGAPMSYWFFVFLAMQLSSRLVQRVGYLFVLAAILTSSYMLSYYAAGAQTARGYDQRTAYAIIHDIEKLIPDFRTNSRHYKLFSYGQIVSNHPYSCRTDCTPAFSLFDYEGCNPHRAVALINALGLASVGYLEPSELQSALPLVKGMPVWPQAGSIRVVDKTILIKLGEPNPSTDNVLRALGVKL